MIIINFCPGGLGFMILKTVYHLWPDTFSKFTHGHGVEIAGSNHAVGVELFLNNHSEIDHDHLVQLESMVHRPSIVLTHNANLLPSHVRQQSWICNIDYDLAAYTAASWMFMNKTGTMVFDGVKSLNIEWYQACFIGMVRFKNLNIKVDSDHNVNFWDLRQPFSLTQLYDQVQHQYSLTPYTLKPLWHRQLYNTSVQSTHLVEYGKFAEIFQQIMQADFIDTPNYQDFFGHKTCQQFEKSMDFLYEKYHSICAKTNMD